MDRVFNGENLDGWKAVENRRTQSKFVVTDDGILLRIGGDAEYDCYGASARHLGSEDNLVASHTIA